jgi:hypothetical protein
LLPWSKSSIVISSFKSQQTWVRLILGSRIPLNSARVRIIVCMEYFSRMLHVASQKADFHFHPKCSSLGISHLAFAYDIILLYRCDLPSVNILFQQLLVFGRMLGLAINASKSSIFFWWSWKGCQT